MNPNPAIVAQRAVRRLPRLALWLFCAAYVLPGFIGREPWKNADMMGLGYMFELAEGRTQWLDPKLLGLPPEFDALLPYWLGALAMQLAPSWVAPDFAARLPSIGFLVLTLLATWYGVYHLARSTAAQPVAFAFGGEAHPTDYARTLADAGLLALIACLGLAQLSHETTPSLAQLGCTALTFHGLAALSDRPGTGAASLAAGLVGMALCGAPAMAVLFALGGALILLLDPSSDAGSTAHRLRLTLLVITLAIGSAAVAAAVGTWHWRLGAALGPGRDWASIARLLAWFTWPAWPLALWTLWRWRRQLASRHVALPAWFALVSLTTAVLSPTADRALLLALPALATLAAFALPTFSRSAASLIDWFTLVFFSGCALVIWVVWVAMQTGVPAKPAANVAKLAPGFEPSFSLLPFLVALAATAAWIWLVRWRASRHRHALWKSLVLPAGGAALGWLLVMTLWLPVLDYARSYVPVVRAITRHLQPGDCVNAIGLTRAHLAALRFHGRVELRDFSPSGSCRWSLASPEVQTSLPLLLDARQWALVDTARRPTDPKDNLLLFRRIP